MRRLSSLATVRVEATSARTFWPALLFRTQLRRALSDLFALYNLDNF